MQTPSFDFVMIHVSDLEASLNFFTNVLGFERIAEGDGPGFRQLTGKGGIEFGLMQADGQRAKPGDIEIYVKTDDIHAMREAIIGKGVAAGPVMDRPFGQIVPLPTVPDGVRVIAMGNPAK